MQTSRCGPPDRATAVFFFFLPVSIKEEQQFRSHEILPVSFLNYRGKLFCLATGFPNRPKETTFFLSLIVAWKSVLPVFVFATQNLVEGQVVGP